MLPKAVATKQAKIRRHPSLTYRLDLKSRRIEGTVDGTDAMIQAINKVLHTERFAWIIYNWDYGMELRQYLGKDMDYVMADLERSVTEALLYDDRILELRGFTMQKLGSDSLSVEFTVQTTVGAHTIEMEVPV